MRLNGVSYFPHNFNSDFIELIEAKFGITGYAIICKLYEKIFFNEGYFMKFNEDIGSIFACKLGVKKGLVSDIVRFAVSRGFFSKELYSKYGILTSSDIQVTYLEITKRRKEHYLKKDYLLPSSIQYLRKMAKKSENDVENVNINEQSKGKESKGKEIEEREKESEQLSLSQIEFKNAFPEKIIDYDIQPWQDMQKLIQSIQKSNFLSTCKNLSLKWFVNNYNKVVSGAYENFVPPKEHNFKNSRDYTEADFKNLFTDLNEAVI